MEITRYFKLLLKNKYLLVIIPLVAIIITYFLVRNQPSVFVSTAQIATGIVDQTKQVSITAELLGGGEQKIQQQFANIIELIKSKKMLDQVSYALMIHDLTANTPFRKPSKLMVTLNPEAKSHMLDVFKQNYKKREALSLFNSDQKGIYEVMHSMGYDQETLGKKLTVYRTESSDFVTISTESDDPQLAAFIVNTLCQEVIEYYDILLKENQSRASNFLKDLLQQKKDTLDKKTQELKNFKINNHILNLTQQAAGVYTELSSYDAKLQEAKREVGANQAAVNGIDAKFDPQDRQYIESTVVRSNSRIVGLEDQIKTLQGRLVASNFQPQYQRQIDSLNRLIKTQISYASDQAATNPLAAKQALIGRKLELQIQTDLAKSSVKILQSKVDELNASLNKLVPFEAVIQSLENQITVGSKEYLTVLEKYNETTLEANFSNRLRVVDSAMPGLAQPSKKMLLVILSGIVMFVFCLFVFFILFLLDGTLKNPRELANKTKTPVVGYLNLLPMSAIDLNKIWQEKDNNPDVVLFRNLLQSIRYEISHELKGTKMLLINSIEPGEGKTYLTMNLAYAYAAINKKVLVIDGNFDNPGITDLVNPRLTLEDFFNGQSVEDAEQNNSKVNVIGNQGGGNSLLETADSDTIERKINELKKEFDIIIVETPTLSALNKAKEWTIFGNKVVTVFEAGQAFSTEYQLSLDYLKSLEDNFVGWVMNMVGKDQLEKGG
ncbi:GumC family protein [Mucilaginibacter ginkgonis]|uniref:Lipopolysaccharide biosynthesis protein n=1 Tax=Mucilaginibacter ginkgonis TaxID=2682091 RepID=A0A6I4IPC3_9SPHI|nr:Wzz/FepE/Etk N-terminal domain-containing protein [Mucilaginibacter ginkgonis]QQL50880.1 lipopolysaccharide biosynthesis protein [Mucilaginibacter ginkgonis]